MKVVAIVVALAVSVVGVVLFIRAVASIVGVVKLGKPAPGRGDHRGQRWRNLLAETLGHTRMLQWTKVGVAHWLVFIAFGALIFTLVTAYGRGQLFDPRFALPIIGHWAPYQWASEIIAWARGFLDQLPDDGPAPARGAGVNPLWLTILAGVLRRADRARDRRVRPRAARHGISAAR